MTDCNQRQFLIVSFQPHYFTHTDDDHTVFLRIRLGKSCMGRIRLNEAMNTDPNKAKKTHDFPGRDD